MCIATHCLHPGRTCPRMSGLPSQAHPTLNSLHTYTIFNCMCGV